MNLSTPEARLLHKALRIRGVPAILELNDGYKTIDIAIPEAKFNIEIDGMHHNFDSKQALQDLKRTYHSFRKGYFTLRVPNSVIKTNINDIADMIVEMLNERNEQLNVEDEEF